MTCKCSLALCLSVAMLVLLGSWWSSFVWSSLSRDKFNGDDFILLEFSDDSGADDKFAGVK